MNIPTQYATADDGTPLHWTMFAPNDGQKHPVVLLLHGGGFTLPNPVPVFVATDLVATGYTVFSNVEYRLAPPNRITGQVSLGQFPNQTDDVTLAVQAAINDPRSNGEVFVIGGSSGGSHAAVLAARGLVKAAVLLSPAMQFDATPTSAQFRQAVNSYAPNRLVEASPNTMLVTEESPIFIVAFTQDSMPANQYTLGVARLVAIGASYDSLLVLGVGHAFSLWSTVKTQAISFLNGYRN